MYKCGWQGCEKAYGTLNHLNAHVTMQSHGIKRTPEGKLRVIRSLYLVSPLSCIDLPGSMHLFTFWTRCFGESRKRAALPTNAIHCR